MFQCTGWRNSSPWRSSVPVVRPAGTKDALIAGLVASTAVAIVPQVISIAAHIVSVFQNAAQIAMQAAGLE